MNLQDPPGNDQRGYGAHRDQAEMDHGSRVKADHPCRQEQQQRKRRIFIEAGGKAEWQAIHGVSLPQCLRGGIVHPEIVHPEPVVQIFENEDSGEEQEGEADEFPGDRCALTLHDVWQFERGSAISFKSMNSAESSLLSEKIYFCIELKF